MATDSATVALPEGVCSDEERLWRAKPGATSTFEENVAARALFVDLHQDQFWDPWRMEEEAAALERAQQIMEEWDRTEPDFKPKTKRQLDAEMKGWDREFERERADREAQRQKNLQRYDAEREQARLALLECRSVLDHQLEEVAQLRSGEVFPAMGPRRRAEKVAELDDAIGRYKARVDELEQVVGDPEDVPDANGHLPADRRFTTLYYYRQHRIDEVLELRAKLPELEAAIMGTEDKAERSKLRAERDIKKARLENLLAVPRLEPEDMCADCATLWDKHGWVTPPADGPCPAWPGWGARLTKVRPMFEDLVRRNEESKAAKKPPPPKPEPLAVLPSGLPIAEIVERLQELQEKYPEAEVRRGRANRWELWPASRRRVWLRVATWAVTRGTLWSTWCRESESRVAGAARSPRHRKRHVVPR
jgi:hypothetical protein